MSQQIRDNLKRLLAPRHLAFIGGRSMARALKRCAEGGYQGQMWLVNPQHDSLEGVPCVRSVAELPCGPDAVFIATNRELTLTCVAELAARGAGGAICYASGFAETGAKARPCKTSCSRPPATWPCSAPTATACSITCTARPCGRSPMAARRGEGRCGADPERQLCLQPVHE